MMVSIALLLFNYLLSPFSPYAVMLSFKFDFQTYFDYPTYTFPPELLANHCRVHGWNKYKAITIYNCTKQSNYLNIAIVSFHIYSNGSRYQQNDKLILSNHIGYVMRHNYMYFDVNKHIFEDEDLSNYFMSTMPESHAMNKIQKAFIVYAILSEWATIDYVLWIDFDAVFFNCSTTIQSVIEYTNNIYNGNNAKYGTDIIFALDTISLANTGVILWKNTKWTKQLLLKMIFIIKNVAKFQFHLIWSSFEHFVDQNMFNALMLGFDPMNGSYVIFHQHLLKHLEIIKTNQKQNGYSFVLNNAQNSIYLHNKYLDSSIQNHSAIIPEFHLNVLLAHWIASNFYNRHKFKYHPFIVHFAGAAKRHLTHPQFARFGCPVLLDKNH